MEFVFTKPKLSDAKEILKYANELVDEKAHISLRKHVTLKQEKEFIQNHLKRMRRKEGVAFFVRHKQTGEIAASGEIFRRSIQATPHIASIGLSVRKKYRNLGLGTLLLRRLVEEGEKIKGVQIIHLDVHANNENAIRLYKRNGFREVSRLPDWVDYYGKRVDHIDMYYKGK